MHLLTSYFLKTDDPARQMELDYCLLKNLTNNAISKIHIFLEEDINFEDMALQYHTFKIKNIIKIVIGKWLTYFDAFTYANNYLKGEVCLLSNADIYFDDSIQKATSIAQDEVYCLSRWELHNDKRVYIRPIRYHSGSHDAWVFRPPIIINENHHFNLGTEGCDTRIAGCLHNSNYKLVNPSLSIKAIHFHMMPKANSAKYEKLDASLPFKKVMPSVLGK